MGWGAGEVVVPDVEPIVEAADFGAELLKGLLGGLVQGLFEVVIVLAGEALEGALEEARGCAAGEFGEDGGTGFGEVAAAQEEPAREGAELGERR